MTILIHVLTSDELPVGSSEDLTFSLYFVDGLLSFELVEFSTSIVFFGSVV